MTWQLKLVSCGNAHTAVVTVNGCLYVWGCGDSGRLGVPCTLRCWTKFEMRLTLSRDYTAVPFSVHEVSTPMLVTQLLDDETYVEQVRVLRGAAWLCAYCVVPLGCAPRGAAQVSCGNAHTLVVSRLDHSTDGAGVNAVNLTSGGRVYQVRDSARHLMRSFTLTGTGWQTGSPMVIGHSCMKFELVAQTNFNSDPVFRVSAGCARGGLRLILVVVSSCITDTHTRLLSLSEGSFTHGATTSVDAWGMIPL